MPKVDDLRSRRAKRGWKQQELADASGLPLETIVGIENGKNTNWATIDRLAETFSVTRDKLMHESPIG
jgi:transcriptional regulator with XRE-family HTH domain